MGRRRVRTEQTMLCARVVIDHSPNRNNAPELNPGRSGGDSPTTSHRGEAGPAIICVMKNDWHAGSLCLLLHGSGFVMVQFAPRRAGRRVQHDRNSQGERP